jgi:hypothetical protein
LAIGLTIILNLISPLSSAEVWAGNSNNNNRQGWPTRRVGGGSRGCIPENAENQPIQTCRPPLLALTPDGLASSAQALPSFWFYLPQIEYPDRVVLEFVLRDEDDRLVYEATFKPTHQGEITSFQLSESTTFKGLVEGKVYHWYLSVIHEAEDRAHDDVVEGWVQRVPLSPTIAQQLQQATPLEKVQIYQDANLWPEAIATIASLRQIQPNDPLISQTWRQLVVSLELPLLPDDLLDGRQRSFATADRR